jgi:hypothetical protein
MCACACAYFLFCCDLRVCARIRACACVRACACMCKFVTHGCACLRVSLCICACTRACVFFPHTELHNCALASWQPAGCVRSCARLLLDVCMTVLACLPAREVMCFASVQAFNLICAHVSGCVHVMRVHPCMCARVFLLLFCSSASACLYACACVCVSFMK